MFFFHVEQYKCCGTRAVFPSVSWKRCYAWESFTLFHNVMLLGLSVWREKTPQRYVARGTLSEHIYTSESCCSTGVNIVSLLRLWTVIDSSPLPSSSRRCKRSQHWPVNTDVNSPFRWAPISPQRWMSGFLLLLFHIDALYWSMQKNIYFLQKGR